MRIITVKCLDDNFSYILINEESNNACVIDPGESKPIIDIILKQKLKFKIYTKYTPSWRSCRWKFRFKGKV